MTVRCQPAAVSSQGTLAYSMAYKHINDDRVQTCVQSAIYTRPTVRGTPLPFDINCRSPFDDNRGLDTSALHGDVLRRDDERADSSSWRRLARRLRATRLKLSKSPIGSHICSHRIWTLSGSYGHRIRLKRRLGVRVRVRARVRGRV